MKKVRFTESRSFRFSEFQIPSFPAPQLSLQHDNTPKDSPKFIVPWCPQKKTAHGLP
jgi:hypothetical protein